MRPVTPFLPRACFSLTLPCCACCECLSVPVFASVLCVCLTVHHHVSALSLRERLKQFRELEFIPFNPTDKRTEATVQRISDHSFMRVRLRTRHSY